MYISSDGTKKDVKTLHIEYLINALAKCNREIFNSKNEEEFNKTLSNIEVLEYELNNRFNQFLLEKLEGEWKWI